MDYQTLLVEIKHGIGIVWMNRPKLHNVLDETMIAEMTAAMRALDDDPSVRAVVLAGAGKSFCAGADLNWMERMADCSLARNRADALDFATMLHDDRHPEKTDHRPRARSGLCRRRRIGGGLRHGGGGLRCGVLPVRSPRRPHPGDDRAVCGAGDGRAHGAPLFPFRGALHRRRGVPHRAGERHRAAGRTRRQDQRAPRPSDPGRSGGTGAGQGVDPHSGRRPDYSTTSSKRARHASPQRAPPRRAGRAFAPSSRNAGRHGSVEQERPPPKRKPHPKPSERSDELVSAPAIKEQRGSAVSSPSYKPHIPGTVFSRGPLRTVFSAADRRSGSDRLPDGRENTGR